MSSRLKPVLRDVRNFTVGAGLLANVVEHSPLQRLTQRVRQQAGSYKFICPDWSVQPSRQPWHEFHRSQIIKEPFMPVHQRLR
jgi:hypothetical protein